MKNAAGVALTTSAIFLVFVAILLNSPALFYMFTAIIATIVASRLQAYLSVRGLTFTRTVPSAVRVGERVTVTFEVESQRRLRRPLISIVDELPNRLVVTERTPSLPVAPAMGQAIQSRYSFRPMRRGKFRWSGLTVYGADALGLVVLTKHYDLPVTEMTVYPAPIPVSLSANPSSGYGTADLESGRARGTGIEPRGIREYVVGDPLRYVHWPSSARTGKLMVKEFESGTGLVAAFALQRTRGTEVGTGLSTTLEAMCGHAVYLAEQYMRRHAKVTFPTLEPGDPDARLDDERRRRQIDELLAEIQADRPETLAEEIAAVAWRLPEGTSLFTMVAVRDPELPAVLAAQSHLQRFALIYDPADYHEGRQSPPPSAADPIFLEELRAAGVETIVMPRVIELERNGRS